MSTVFAEHARDEIGLTWEEFLALPYETRNTDLIDGKLVVNAPNLQHEIVVANLQEALRQWRRLVAPRSGATATQQPVPARPNRGYQPDLAWYPAERCVWADDGSVTVSGLPSIVIEVLSPSTRGKDLVKKRGDYELLGIDEYWILDPIDRSALRMVRRAQGPTFDDVDLAATETLRTDLLPGFEVVVGSLFVDE